MKTHQRAPFQLFNFNFNFRANCAKMKNITSPDVWYVIVDVQRNIFPVDVVEVEIVPPCFHFSRETLSVGIRRNAIWNLEATLIFTKNGKNDTDISKSADPIKPKFESLTLMAMVFHWNLRISVLKLHSFWVERSWNDPSDAFESSL